jgi:5-methylcytosine-specific restriction endonuclease McrA
MEYWEKLKDPRWQKLRLEAMEKADFHCEFCGNGEETLNVHHKEYFKSREPWEYHPKQLAVLCKSCHEYTHSKDDFLKKVCSFADIDGPYSRTEFAWFVGGALGIPYEVMLEWGDAEDCKYFQYRYKKGTKFYAK